MRDHPVRVLSAFLSLIAASAAAQSPLPAASKVSVQLAAEQTLSAGSHAAIEVIVELPEGNDSPLLLTPSLEGDAVEVVRGRLSRPDGKAVAGPGIRLRFEVPIRARSEGTAILHVDVMTYVCSRTCQRVLLRGSQVLRVR